MSTWRNRIVGEGQEDPAAITENPLNWRVHPKLQRETLEDSLSTIGWIQKPIINRTTGHLIDGHLRVLSAAARGEPFVPVTYVELTEDEERAALASLDPMAGMAVMDGEKLTELLTDLEMGGGELNALFDDLREQAEGSTLAAAEKSGTGLLSKGLPVVKAVIAVTDMNVIERALAATGQAGRGDALLTICREFLKNEKGQHDAGPEDRAAPIAAAQDPLADHPRDARGRGPNLEADVQPVPAGHRVRGEVGEGGAARDPAPDVGRLRSGLRKITASRHRGTPKNKLHRP
jgi:ParB-like chromosome segregation protein Spo0J